MLCGAKTERKFCGNDIATASPQGTNVVGKDYFNSDTNIRETDGLTPDDLVFLYQNCDADPQLVSTTSDIMWPASNEYVETVIHQDYPAHDISSGGSLEDINNILLINNERLNLLNNPSYEMSLDIDHKCEYLDFQHWDLAAECEPNFLKDSYKHFRILNNMTMESESYELPKSLLDYIYCKRLEDNFSFDMNNIIIYVKNTIEQLKRISNGEFLSEKAKEKWREVDKCNENINYEDVNLSVNQVLANTVSIPVYAERKTTNSVMTWDDIVHSEMDLKSLCKLLQKQIILQVPKLVNCPYTLFSKSWNDGVVLRCIKDSKPGKRQTCPRVDVFLQLQRSDSGHLLNNINSIMILRKSPFNIQDTCNLNNITKCDANYNKALDNLEMVMDLNIKEVDKKDINNHDMCLNEVTDIVLYKNNNENVKDGKCEELYQSENLRENLQSSIARLNDFTSIDSSTDLMLSMKQLNMECTVPEETEEQVRALKETVKFNKRKSPTLKTRIKSPYENKNNALEEKKRKRLLEIRERREKRKLIISENCKMKKNKYGKSFVQAQASSSVTRLSITNKAFYRSIFGDSSGTLNSKTSECNNKDMKITKTTHYKHSDQEHNTIDSILLNNKNDCESSISQSSSENIPTFTITNDVDHKDLSGTLNIQRKLINIDENVYRENKIPSSSPKLLIKKTLSSSSISLEFKESINKIYDIIGTNKISGNNVEDGKNVNELNNHKSYTVNSTVIESDSGTSLKYDLTSSISSSYNFNKIRTENFSKKQTKKITNFTEPMIPKVVISSKISPGTQEIPKNETINHRKFIDTTINNKNPLKTISRILDQIEDVQKVKNKVKENDRSGNRNTVHNNLKYNININRSNKYAVENKPTTTVSSKNCRRKSINPLEKTSNVPSVLLTSQFDNINVKHIDETQNYNISSIIEEAKEARGEAVRGPSKNISRINYLAQPRKFNVAANSEDFQRKYGSNFNVNRIQRFSPPVQPEKAKPIYTTVNKGNKILKKNMKTTDYNKVIEKPLENKDKISTSKSPKMYNSKEFEKKSVSFVKANFDRMKINQDTFFTGKINNKLKTREAPTSEKNNSGNRFIPTNFGFIEPSLPKNKALYGLQLHKMVNKILNKTELNDLPEDSESNSSESPTKQIKVNAEGLADQENDLKVNIIKYSKDENDENKNIITVTLPTTIIDESSINSNTPSEIQVRDSQFLSVQDDGFYSNANSLEKIQSNLLETVSNNVLCDLKLSSSGINLTWPFKSFQFTTVGYAFPNFTAMKPIKKTFLKNTFSSTTNTILMIDKPTQIIETVTTKTEIALQTDFDNILSDRIFLNKLVQSEEFFTPNTCNIENNAVVRVTHLDNESDSTSSLDLLVTLLNEIQSITTCQSELMRVDTEPFRVDTVMEIDQADVLNDQENNTLNFYVLNNNENNNINNYHESEQNCLIETKPNLNKITTDTKEINSTRIFPLSQSLDAGDCKAIDNKINITYGKNNNDKENKHNDKIRLNKNNVKTSIISFDKKKENDLITEDQSRIKIKRDVLVTMYSVLIFTVFAALSIPEILNL